MKGIATICTLTIFSLLGFALPAAAQQDPDPDGRPDAIWARHTDQDIALDGQLDESAWAEAESLMISYESSAGLPGSGWRDEVGTTNPSDPTRATVKFLARGDSLYMAVVVPDSSIGGSANFNEFDGFLMDLRDHSVPVTQAGPPVEYFYSWWYPGDSMPDDSTGIPPDFIGGYGSFPPVGPDSSRSADKVENWDAATTIQGESNTDETVDEGYTVEMRFRVDQLGYDLTRAEGEIVDFNLSIYDADWNWPRNGDRFTANRSWWQDPWGNTVAFNQARIHVRPDVTVNSGAVPELGPDAIIPNGEDFDDPTIDGSMDEEVWAEADGIEVQYDNEETFSSYSGAGPFASGQFQLPIDDMTADVVDPGDATFKWFFKGNTLYLGADVRDQSVAGRSNSQLWDGVRLVLQQRDTVNADHVPLPRGMLARVDTTGGLAMGEHLLVLASDSVDAAEVGLTLKENTTVNDPNDVDEGYQIELALDLTAFGYPDGRGDGLAFTGLDLLDGDVFQDPANNYGTRAWWYRDRPVGGISGYAGSFARAFMDPDTPVGTSIADGPNGASERLRVLGNAPNPFREATTLRYTLPRAGTVQVEVYDVLGRRVAKVSPGAQGAGKHRLTLREADLPSGVYFYRVELDHGEARQHAMGRMVHVK